LEEAKERGCDYVLYVALTRKRPAAARGSGGSFGGGTKTGDEFTFDFKVVAVGGTQGTVERTLKGTAASDGQDVVTAMIETAAQVVVELARQARPAVAEAKVNSDPVVQPKTPAPAPASAEPAPEPIPTGYGSLSATPKSSSTSSRNNDPAKGEGVIRIGIVTPRVTSAGSGIGGNSEANSLRTTFTSFLAGSNIETIDLKARLEGLAITEAQRRQCDFVLYTTLVRKRAGSSSGGGGPINSIMGNVGGGGGGGVGTKIPGSKTVKDVTSEAARVSSTLASFARANDEVTFEYKLVTSAGAKPIAGKSTKAKVKNDGEDVLTPMIESAAQTIVDATIKP